MASTYLLSKRNPRSIIHAIRSLGRAIGGEFLLQLLLVFVAYVIAGKLGQATTNIRSSNLGPVWPAYGIALAAFLICGARVWPAVLAAAFLVAFFSPVPHLAALGQAAGATIAAMVGAFLLHRIGFERSLSRLSDALSLVALGGFASAMLSASFGVMVLYAAQVHAYSGLGPAWLIYWLGDATGVLLVTPLALRFTELLKLRGRDRMTEFAALLFLLSATCLLIFSDRFSIPFKLDFMAFAVLPFIIWAAIRFGVAATALSILIVAGTATIATALGSGPFATHTTFVNAVLLDVFFAVLSVTGLSLAAVIAEREHAEREREQVVSRQAAMEARLGMSRKLIDAQEQERTRIARELHDDISQRLALLAIEIDVSRQKPPVSADDLDHLLAAIWNDVAAVASDVQSMSHQLHSSQLEHLGIVAAMESLCRDFEVRQKVQIDFTHEEIRAAVPVDISLCLFRVLQEALLNAIKHSHTRRFEVMLGCSANQLQLKVSDRGKGFNIHTAAHKGGLGLISMRERVRLVNGTIAIESTKGGTTIHVRVPLAADSSEQRAAG